MSVSIYSHPHNMGDDDGPLAADHYKRAVLRPAPSRFAIEFHEPCKVGGSSSYSFGMRVSPIITGDRASVSSLSSSSEYDVWRRWEDCLWFQDNLELEYERSARQKRQRLIQGKGVKKHGFYLQDKASSFESLPPGPDPDSIKRDIHDYIPKLTKRGTIFRASAATIAQRNAELQAFVEALFKEGQPALIRDMRSTRLVTDFFGIWHRDAELAAKKRKASRESHASITPSVFSSYFSAASTPSLSESLSSYTSPKSSLANKSFLRQRTSSSAERPHSTVSSQATARPSRGRAGSESIMGSPTSSVRRRPTSTMSSDSSISSSSSSGGSDTGTISDISRGTAEAPVSLLETYPEEYNDVVPPLKKQEYAKSPRSSMAHRASMDRRNRNAQIFISPPKLSPLQVDFQAPKEPVDDPSRSMRESWASVDSTATYLEGLNIGFTSSSSGYRQSMASIKTFMTTDSTEAVIPRAAPVCASSPMNGRGGSTSTFVRPSPRASIPVSLSDFDMFPEIAEDDDIDAICDAFPRPATLIPERPETPVAQVRFPSVPQTAAPPSPTTSVSTMHSSSTGFSASTASSATTVSSGDGDMLSLKVLLNDLIVMLRVSRDSSYTELRQRIFNKFIGQEGIPLSKEFKITVVVADVNSPMAHLCKPSNSMLGTAGDEVELRMVECQGDWEIIAYATEGHKFSLRIFDNPIGC